MPVHSKVSTTFSILCKFYQAATCTTYDVLYTVTLSKTSHNFFQSLLSVFYPSLKQLMYPLAQQISENIFNNHE